jgi:hypothetical protein
LDFGLNRKSAIQNQKVGLDKTAADVRLESRVPEKDHWARTRGTLRAMKSISIALGFGIGLVVLATIVLRCLATISEMVPWGL